MSDLCNSKHTQELVQRYCEVAVRCSGHLGKTYGREVGYHDIDHCKTTIMAKCQEQNQPTRQATMMSIAATVLHGDDMIDAPTCLAGLTYAPTIGRVTESITRVTDIPSLTRHPDPDKLLK
jgi:hypothetical protein